MSLYRDFDFQLRRGAISASCFYTIAWVLTVALMTQPFNTMSWAGYLAATGVCPSPLQRRNTVTDIGVDTT